MPVRPCRVAGLLMFLVFVVTPAHSSAQETLPDHEWPTYGGDLASTRYAPLDQITAENFGDLELAWTFQTDSFGPRPEFNFQGTPLMVNGVVYTTAGRRRAVAALDAVTGELLWMHRFDEGERGEQAPRRLSGRGLTYWDDGGSGRIFYVTPGYLLIALDAATGHQIPNFGLDGIVDLKRGLDQEIDLVTGEVGLHAAPIVAGGTILIGAAHEVGSSPVSRENVKGYVRGFDVRTGERKWIFHTLPQPGEYGHDSWLNDSWRYTGNTGMWGQATVDLELGLVYLPLEMPTGDYYGGHRHGDNLFSDSLVAVDLETGERVWHYQTVHHDVWDYDLPCAPILADITVDGRDIKAIVQPTKQSWLFVLDRETGKPVWPIEERPMPSSDVAGELLAPTQPYPTKPPPFDRQGIGPDDLIDFTPALRAEALEIASRYRLGPLYTPPSVATADGTYGTLMVPSSTGGPNWPGGSLDPETGIFYIYSKTQVTSLSLINDPEQSDMDFIRGRPRDVNAAMAALTVSGLPLMKPPWGRITAIDLNAGEILWQVAHGETADRVREHPALQHLDIPRTGRVGRVGTLVTKTLVIAGDGGVFTSPEGVEGARLRAYDKATGQEVGSVFMPSSQTGSPMTYRVGGVQYIVIAIGGGTYAAELLAFRLPESEEEEAEADGAP